MLLGFITLKTIYLIAHVFGAILGAGGAFTSDAMFFNSIKDGKINRKELDFMKLGGRLVWTGVIIMVVSGILLVSTDPDGYFSSAKFLAKMTIVGIIILNGIIFHALHIPHIRKHMDIDLLRSRSFMKKANFILISGAISMTSWISTVILGMLKNVPYSFMQIFSIYLVLILGGVTGALILKKLIVRFVR